MEEWVGKVWHQWVTRSVTHDYPQARVDLDDMRKTLGIVLRALGGDAGLQIRPSTAVESHAPRTLMQRIAGTGLKTQAAWRDADSLNLPDSIALFPQRELNRELYLWLTVLGSEAGCMQYASTKSRYQRLLTAWQILHPEATELPLQLTPAPNSPAASTPVSLAEPAPPEPNPNSQAPAASCKRQRAERTDMPDGSSGLLLFRLESLFSWTEYTPVDRTSDEGDNDDATRAADDMDVITVARDRKTSARKIKLDLDLPNAEYDDIPQGEGIPLPEWDCRKQRLLPDHCRLQIMLPRGAQDLALPAHLQAPARQLRRRFEALQPRREWRNHQQDGAELDTDSYILHLTERQRGQVDMPMVYRDCREQGRDLSCLLLADFSMSTDSWVSNQARVVDVVRDALILFAESLQATRDRFALYGFSSVNRQNVRLYHLKSFNERYDGQVHGRIMATQPGYYTRMGAAIRHATHLLEAEPSQQKLLLLLTDGKPNDLDIYEGRYGLEDTRMALQEARRKGLKPFCVTIDDRAEDYLPRLFGQNGWVLVKKAEELPQKLPQLYALLTER
ncbi:MAG TPA: VWA domain-containing protein [Candidatus Thiothrix moscowensis]|uniref:nitric oxide reductase activation protein NorD n=1 Tax=unclassified Thiothrix TaxID=2636184 RepID=UPI0025FDFEE9|nr:MULTISPECIES: VWA domain-containing protein [unclassified Thiothrix]HRJ53165.1 VWA domain-containing protein [Candidatus Thiothrix moscowensis]HRJ93265.1 VWA domain-containing protein [Candidatus Thiothrix moscowensis]